MQPQVSLSLDTFFLIAFSVHLYSIKISLIDTTVSHIYITFTSADVRVVMRREANSSKASVVFFR